MNCYIIHKSTIVSSTPYRAHTSWCLFSTMMLMILFLSACLYSGGRSMDDGNLAKITFTFTTNGGIQRMPAQKIQHGTTAPKPDNPTRDGHVFGRWYTDNTAFEEPFTFSTPTIQNNILYAKWNGAPPADTSLGKIITKGTIPQDLSKYNEMVQAILTPYKSTASVEARYVTITGLGNKDGSSWEHAASQDKLHATLSEITDASGNRIYLLLIGVGDYDAGAPLSMKNHVAIVGGWNQNGGWTRSADTRTVLSGNNTRRVFDNNNRDPLFDQINSTAILYDVKITKGIGKNGGGMVNSSASPTLMNVTFSGNKASYNGGGMYNGENSSPILTNITFSGNRATRGGGMYNKEDSSPVLTNITFSKNTATNGNGGGMYNISSPPTLTNVTFSENTAKYNGGGMYNEEDSSPVLTNVTFSGNRANKSGGGMANYNSSPTIVNTVLWDNTATTGPQIYAENGGTITLAYSVINKGSTTRNGIMLARGSKSATTVTKPNYTNPNLSPIANNGGSVSTLAITSSSPAANIGVHVRKKDSTFYYSINGSTWYTGLNKRGLTTKTALPADTITLTATDATGTTRTDRPDAGAYEARSVTLK